MRATKASDPDAGLESESVSTRAREEDYQRAATSPKYDHFIILSVVFVQCVFFWVTGYFHVFHSDVLYFFVPCFLMVFHVCAHVTDRQAIKHTDHESVYFLGNVENERNVAHISRA